MSTMFHPESPLTFPLEWRVRIMTRSDAVRAPEDIRNTLRSLGLDAEPVPGNVSSGGTYVTYTVCITLPDRVAMEQIGYALSRIEGVQRVL